MTGEKINEIGPSVQKLEGLQIQLSCNFQRYGTYTYVSTGLMSSPLSSDPPLAKSLEQAYLLELDNTLRHNNKDQRGKDGQFGPIYEEPLVKCSYLLPSGSYRLTVIQLPPSWNVNNGFTVEAISIIMHRFNVSILFVQEPMVHLSSSYASHLHNRLQQLGLGTVLYLL